MSVLRMLRVAPRALRWTRRVLMNAEVASDLRPQYLPFALDLFKWAKLVDFEGSVVDGCSLRRPASVPEYVAGADLSGRAR